MLCIILIHWKPGGNRFVTAWWARLKASLSHETEILYLPGTAAELLEFLHPITSQTFSLSLATFFFSRKLISGFSLDQKRWSGQGKAQILVAKMWLQIGQTAKGRAFVMLVKLPLPERFSSALCDSREKAGWRKRTCFGTGTGKLRCLLASMWHLLV